MSTVPRLDRMPKSLVDTLNIIREDLHCHQGDWTLPGFQALAVHRFGRWRRGVEPRPLRAPLTALYRGMFVFVRNVYGIELPDTATVGRRVVIEHQGGIVVHGQTTIGDDSRLRQGVTLGNRRLEEPDAAPVIGDHVNIGAGAQVLGAVRVGDHATIGANAVVLRDVPAGATVVGVPGQVLETPSASSRRGSDSWPQTG
jgi:serine O-acetyltransferase